MPEVGNMALPAKLLARGVRDMVRISDGRMSGTAYGTVVLHVAPGRRRRPWPWSAPATRSSWTSPRTLHLDVPPEELARRAPSAAAAAAYAAPPAAGSASSTTSSRPTAAPTSTSWSVPAARGHRESH